jgi:inosine-uridine nucleoside N-ribohydrolase
MRHIIIDTDPGVDDALSLILAFNSPELKVEAVTTVVGNVGQKKAYRNALQILDFLDINSIPVGKGAIKPLLRKAADATGIHGESGLGDAILPEPRSRSYEKPAVELILEKAEEFDTRLKIVAVGPLTNIASAILVDPMIVNKLAGLVIMGGAYGVTQYGYGNVTPVAEFNIWHDPEAAKIVFDSGIPLIAVGLDVTTHIDNRLSNSVFKEIERMQTKRSKLVADLSRNLVKRFGSISLHDPMAIAVAIDPKMVERKRFAVDVEIVSELTRGQTVTDRRKQNQLLTRKKPNVDVCVSVNSKRFLKMFMDRVVHGK